MARTAGETGCSLLGGTGLMVPQFKAMMLVVLGNLRMARWSSLVVVACVMLVTIVLGAFLAMAQGFAATAQSAGSDRVVILLGRQSQSEANSQISREQIELLANTPGIARDNGVPVFSPELVMTVSGKSRDEHRKINATLRGLQPAGLKVRPGFRITAGRMPQPGRTELIVGRKLRATMANTEPGRTLMLAGRQWTVVGTFGLNSEIFETEIYADLSAMQSAYGRENQIQAVRAMLDKPEGVGAVRAFLAGEPRLDLEAPTERELYAEQVKSTSDLILVLGWPLAAILAVGVTTGVFNTMLIVLEGRRHSLRTLAMLGVTPPVVVSGVVLESVVLSLVGACVGLLLIFVVMQGAESSMIGQGFSTVSYRFKLDAIAIAQSLALALGIGVLGGLVPGFRLLKPKRS